MNKEELKRYYVYWNNEVFYTLAENEEKAILQTKNEIKEMYHVHRVRNIYAEEDKFQ